MCKPLFAQRHTKCLWCSVTTVSDVAAPSLHTTTRSTTRVCLPPSPARTQPPPLPQVAFNSPAPPPPSLPASVQAAFAATNVTGFDNGTILSASNATSMPPVGGGAAAGGLPGAASDAGNSSRGVTVTVTVTAQQPSLQTELLSLSVQPDYLAPLKVVVGISSSFITNGFQPSSDFGRTLAGTEVLRWVRHAFLGESFSEPQHAACAPRPTEVSSSGIVLPSKPPLSLLANPTRFAVAPHAGTGALSTSQRHRSRLPTVALQTTWPSPHC